MLRSNSKSLGGSCIVSPGEEKERLQWEGFAVWNEREWKTNNNNKYNC